MLKFSEISWLHYYFLVMFFSAISSFLWVKCMRAMRANQVIRKKGPQTHLLKKDTPTMGGVVIIVVWFCASFFIFLMKPEKPLLMMIIMVLAYAAIGLFDDVKKIYLQHSDGLSGRYKIAAQLLVGFVFIYFFQGFWGEHEHYMVLPWHHLHIHLGHFYWAWFLVVLLGGSHAVNLTDGLDGLVTYTSLVLLSVYYVCGALGMVPMNTSILISVMVMMIVLGVFSFWNAHPAKLFMGDVGSLGLGAFISMLALLTHSTWFLFMLGMLYVLETCSVMLQVGSMKLRSKRIFKMAPLHHHFELLGWSESKVTFVFTLFSILFACMAVIIWL